MIELDTIAEYGFCLPCDDAVSQEEAYSIAVNSVMHQYGLLKDWDSETEVYYSFFCDDGESVCGELSSGKLGMPLIRVV